MVLTIEAYSLSIDNRSHYFGYVYFVNNGFGLVIKNIVILILCFISVDEYGFSCILSQKMTIFMKCLAFCFCMMLFIDILCSIGNFSMCCHVEKLVIRRCYFAGSEKNWLFVLVSFFGLVSCYFVFNSLGHLKNKVNCSNNW